MESVDTLDGVITVSEVQAAIKVLKDKKAAGPDGLSSEFFRYSAPCVLHFLTEYFIYFWMIWIGYPSNTQKMWRQFFQ